MQIETESKLFEENLCKTRIVQKILSQRVFCPWQSVKCAVILPRSKGGRILTKPRKTIWTVPNLLTCVRLLLIPFFLHAYLVQGDARRTAGLLALSFVTDVADGFIARRFHQISELGKALDPVADKLTQGAMLLCLVGRFPVLIVPLVLFAFKELTTGVFSLFAIRRSGAVESAAWHGKVTTFLLYLLLLLHILWSDIPGGVSVAAAALATAMMLISFLLYTLRNVCILRAAKEKRTEIP